jgi:NAD(P)-dependent dehydrogenase (short-subunit alcohol dehydrogenase family)
MTKPTVLIIGASRGIGMGFVSKYLSAGWSVHATARKQADIAVFPTGVTGHLMDVTDKNQVDGLAAALRGQPFDLLIHNAGVGRGSPQELMTRVNVEAPFEVIEAFLPAVAASEQKKIAILSSQLGSRERFGDGKIPTDLYGASKCLLNDKFRVEELQWRELGVSSLGITCHNPYHFIIINFCLNALYFKYFLYLILNTLYFYSCSSGLGAD